jgi:hypothetical protein
MKTVEVKILQYVFHFRQMLWREETLIKFDKNTNRLRTILSHAMTEVSGIKVDSPGAAMKLLRVLPETVVERVFILYKGSMPNPRRFATVGLYKAPEPGKLVKRMAEVEEQRDQTMDRVEREMEQKFGKQEIRETLEAERQMIKNSKLRGATPATPDRGTLGEKPPVKQGFVGELKQSEVKQSEVKQSEVKEKNAN